LFSILWTTDENGDILFLFYLCCAKYYFATILVNLRSIKDKKLSLSKNDEKYPFIIKAGLRINTGFK